MLLFSPYDAVVLGHGVTTFDVFYFILERRPSKVIDWALLWIELYWVLINAAVLWLCFRVRPPQCASAGR
jgi:hypothetical protein